MARTPMRQLRAQPSAVRRASMSLRAEDVMTERAARMARFAAGVRQVIARAVAVGFLLAAGWLLAVLFGMTFAAPAAADSTAAPGVGAPLTVTGSVIDGFAAVDGTATALDDAEAMAGLTVDGLTSQSDPGLPAPSTASKMLDTDGLVPNGGGSGPFGPGLGDIARSVDGPRPEAVRAPLARVLPPVVRTAADDPSFSPD
ncbi:hypothetical protein [Nonomuraea cavernae]|uniref:Uncharacterized protein n=1 Tax=Nonomuraea cavernae TaxID=2045107 RepID=A0A917YRM4_9ACTN|nr:hypothetical protein [Nonomuraea cavernae]MCA2183925.1 hypothetical protein [Nonomuraea cavernae]GGO61789.1 hypothetical protein GCM10012289_04860 [Nonomuraea cavernae]